MQQLDGRLWDQLVEREIHVCHHLFNDAVLRSGVLLGSSSNMGAGLHHECACCLFCGRLMLQCPFGRRQPAAAWPARSPRRAHLTPDTSFQLLKGKTYDSLARLYYLGRAREYGVISCF